MTDIVDLWQRVNRLETANGDIGVEILKEAIDAAVKEERETCVKIVQKFADCQFIYQEAADLIIRDIQRGQL